MWWRCKFSGYSGEQKAWYSFYFVLGNHVAVFFLDIVDSTLDWPEKQGAHVGGLPVVRVSISGKMNRNNKKSKLDYRAP